MILARGYGEADGVGSDSEHMTALIPQASTPAPPEPPFLLEKAQRSITFGWKRPADMGAKIMSHTLVFGKLAPNQVLPESSAEVEALLAAVEETQVIKLDVPALEDWADLLAEVSDLTP